MELESLKFRDVIKCGVRIVNVAFHWNTGVIDNGPVHNPHFYEYQKNADENGVAPRNPGDIVCGGMCHYVELRGCLRIILQEQNTL